ncbi:ion channel-forming bestrophin family protein, partial [Lecanoromycetidae sp. Uapishka_2]
MSATNTISTDNSDIQQEKMAPPKSAFINISTPATPLRDRSPNPNQFMRPGNRRQTSLNVEEHATKPADLEKHSKLPYFMRMKGSIGPRLLVPLGVVCAWSTLITCISQFVYPLVVSSLLLTILGFVVALGISFRTSSAYERYVEGRKAWAQLQQTSRDLARHIWIHVNERHEEDSELGKADLLAKLTALNLIVAFSLALKHKLRFEPYVVYDDDNLDKLIGNLSTFAGEATDPDRSATGEKSRRKKVGEWLGLTFAESNPRKLIKRAVKSNKTLGNLPFEILTYLSAYIEDVVDNKTLRMTAPEGLILGNLTSMNEVLAQTERILNTPLPIAYSIAISQITWVYVLALPFQLWDALRWITIPGTVIGAYIILGIAAIGREIENPFGYDDNDLPLERFCDQIAADINIITSKPRPRREEFVANRQNRPLYNLSYQAWDAKSTEEIRDTLKTRPHTQVQKENPDQGAPRMALAAV